MAPAAPRGMALSGFEEADARPFLPEAAHLRTGIIAMRFLRLFSLAAGVAFLAACGDETGPTNAAPAATFVAQCGPLQCTLTNGSTDPDGAIETYAWDFGDDSDPATTRDAVHAYAPPGGRYTITLTVTDDDGATATATIEVDVSEANRAPTASFTYACEGLACDFTDRSFDGDHDGRVVSHIWSFGDGQTSAETSPRHTYAAGGTYTVALNVADDLGRGGRDSEQVTVTGTVPGGMAAAFTASCNWLQCTFADNSGDSSGDVIVSWHWDFGDGHTSTAQQPTHVYDVAELTTFQVILTVMNTDRDTADASHDVQVHPPPG